MEEIKVQAAMERQLPEPDSLEIRAVAELFRVFGDPTRTNILWVLNQMEMNVGEISSVLGMTKSAVSHQLRVLREKNLVRKRKVGREVYYSLADDHVRTILGQGTAHLQE